MYKKFRKILPAMRPVHWLVLSCIAVVTCYFLLEIRLDRGAFFNYVPLY